MKMAMTMQGFRRWSHMLSAVKAVVFLTLVAMISACIAETERPPEDGSDGISSSALVGQQASYEDVLLEPGSGPSCLGVKAGVPDPSCSAAAQTDLFPIDPTAVSNRGWWERRVCFFSCMVVEVEPECVSDCLDCAAQPGFFCSAACILCGGSKAWSCAKQCV